MHVACLCVRVFVRLALVGIYNVSINARHLVASLYFASVTVTYINSFQKLAFAFPGELCKSQNRPRRRKRAAAVVFMFARVWAPSTIQHLEIKTETQESFEFMWKREKRTLPLRRHFCILMLWSANISIVEMASEKRSKYWSYIESYFLNQRHRGRNPSCATIVCLSSFARSGHLSLPKSPAIAAENFKLITLPESLAFLKCISRPMSSNACLYRLSYLLRNAGKQIERVDVDLRMEAPAEVRVSVCPAAMCILIQDCDGVERTARLLFSDSQHFCATILHTRDTLETHQNWIRFCIAKFAWVIATNIVILLIVFLRNEDLSRQIIMYQQVTVRIFCLAWQTTHYNLNKAHMYF